MVLSVPLPLPMSTTVEDVLTCPVCLSRFNDPRLLPCQHTFCLRPCLLNIYDESTRTIRCPLCRESSRALRGLENLPRNLTVIALLGVQQQPRRNNSSPDNTATTAAMGLRDLEETANRLRAAVPALLAEAARLRSEAADVEAAAARQGARVTAAIEALYEQLAQRRTQLLAEVAASSAGQLERLYAAMESLELEAASASSCCESLPPADAPVEELKRRRVACEEAARRLAGASADWSGISASPVAELVIDSEPASRAIAVMGQVRRPDAAYPPELTVANNFRTPLNQQQPHTERPQHPSETAALESPVFRRLSFSDDRAGRGGGGFISIANPAFRGNRRPPRLGSDGSVGDGATHRVDASRRAAQAAIRRQERQERQHQQQLELPAGEFTGTTVRVQQAQPIAALQQPTQAPSEMLASVPRSGTFVLSRSVRPVAFQVSLNSDDPSVTFPAASEEAAYLTRSAPRAVFGRPGSDLGQLSAPRGIAACLQTGTLFVADSNNHRLQAFSPSGQPRFTFGRRGAGQGEFECVTGVAADAETRRVFATDRYNHKVLVFDYQGTFLREFGGEGCELGQFRYPWGVAVHTGRLYVADKKNHRVQVFDLEGRFLSSFGEHGRSDGQLDNPHFVCVRPDGTAVLVSDSNNNRVQAFELTSGGFRFKFGVEGSGTGQMRHPRGLACDLGGRVIVVDSGNNRLQVYRADGSFLCHWGATGRRPGCFKGAEGVAAMPDGRLAVTDRDNGRVQLF